MKTVFAENLKRIREERCLTQSELAELSGCTNIAHFEAGSRLPSVKNLCKISAALHVTLDELIQDQRGIGMFDGLTEEQIKTVLLLINCLRMSNDT